MSFHDWDFKLMLYAKFDFITLDNWEGKVDLPSHVIEFALREFISMFTAGPCIPAVPHVDNSCISVWLKLLSST